MHSSRMHTARSSSHLLGEGGVCLSVCWNTPPGVGLETHPQVWAWRPPWEWAWRPPRYGPGAPPPGCVSGNPQARPLNFPLGCGPGDPPKPDLSTPPPGVGLETCNACWDTTHPPPVNRMTDRQV